MFLCCCQNYPWIKQVTVWCGRYIFCDMYDSLWEFSVLHQTVWFFPLFNVVLTACWMAWMCWWNARHNKNTFKLEPRVPTKRVLSWLLENVYILVENTETENLRSGIVTSDIQQLTCGWWKHKNQAEEKNGVPMMWSVLNQDWLQVSADHPLHLGVSKFFELLGYVFMTLPPKPGQPVGTTPLLITQDESIVDSRHLRFTSPKPTKSAQIFKLYYVVWITNVSFECAPMPCPMQKLFTYYIFCSVLPAANCTLEVLMWMFCVDTLWKMLA